MCIRRPSPSPTPLKPLSGPSRPAISRFNPLEPKISSFRLVFSPYWPGATIFKQDNLFLCQFPIYNWLTMKKNEAKYVRQCFTFVQSKKYSNIHDHQKALCKYLQNKTAGYPKFRIVYSSMTFDFFPPPGPLIFFPAGSKYICFSSPYTPYIVIF